MITLHGDRDMIRAENKRAKLEHRCRHRGRRAVFPVAILAFWFLFFAPYPTRYRVLFNGEEYAGEYRNTWFPRWVQFTSEHRDLTWVHYFIAKRMEDEARQKAERKLRWRVIERIPAEQNPSILGVERETP